MTPAELKKSLSTLSGAYLFWGEEEYLKHHYLVQVRDTVSPDPAFDVFNHVTLSWDGSFDALSGALAMPPMMADKKLIELHGVDYAALKAEQMSDLCSLLEGVGEDTVVVLYAAAVEVAVQNPKKPPAYFAQLCKCVTPVEFARESPGRLVPWIARHFAHEGITASNEVCTALIDYCTRDMSALANEISKLCAYLHAHERSELARADISYICCRIDEIAAFDFANAILARDRKRAYEILRDMIAKKQKPQNILGSVASVLRDLYRVRTLADCGMAKHEIASDLKLNEYKVGLYLRAASGRQVDALRAALDACARADLQLKSTTLPPFGVLCSLVLAS